MTTTPNEPLEDPDVVPSGEPGVGPGEDPGSQPDVIADPGAGREADPETESGL
jgi:hypothetical protein